MTKAKRITLFAFLLAALLIVLGIWAVAALRPAMPAEWNRIQVGMPRAQVLAILHDEVHDLRKIKGFDSTGREVTMLGVPSYWLLLITYGEADKVVSAEAFFTCKPFGVMNTRKKLMPVP